MRSKPQRQRAALLTPVRRVICMLATVILAYGGTLEARTVRVGIYDNFPKVAVDRKGRPCGIFIDILEAVAAREGWELEYVYGTWYADLALLEKGDIDLMPDVAHSDVRKQRFDFNRITVLPSWIQVYTRAGDPVMTFADLNGRVIAVLRGSLQQQLCADMREKLGLRFTLLALPDYKATIAAVETGRADALAAGRFHAYAHGKIRLEPSPVLIDISTLHYAAPKGRNGDLLSAIDKHLAEYLNDSRSVYYQSLEKWLHSKPRSFIPRYVVWTLALICVVIAFLAIVTVMFRRQLNKRTLELRENNLQLHNIVDELRASEERVTASLREKEQLLQELYHRTRNTMSVICSMLSIKSRTTGSPPVIGFAADIEKKIHSMALVHDMLYRSNDLSSIDIGSYIDELIKSSLEYYAHLNGRITFTTDIEHTNMLIDIAVPFGIVLNELLTNSCTHAFPDGAGGTIGISLKKTDAGRIHVEFSDSGAGVHETFDFRKQETLGMQLIFGIVEKQLRGTVDCDTRSGIRYIIEFPSTLYSRRV